MAATTQAETKRKGEEEESASPVTVTKVKEKLFPGHKGPKDDGLERKMVAEHEQPEDTNTPA